MGDFDWFLEPPKWLSWLGVLALGVALMVLPQMIWGRPRLKIESSYMETDDARLAIFTVLSMPLTNPVLNLIGVYRRAVPAVAILSVVDARTNQLEATWTPEIKSVVGQASHRMILEPSHLPYQIVVAATSSDGASELVARNESGPLKPGIYRIHLELFAERPYDIADRLNIGTQRHDLHWDSTSS